MHMNAARSSPSSVRTAPVRRRCSTTHVSTNPRRGRSTSPIARRTIAVIGRRRIVSRGPACREPFRRHASSARSPYLRTSRSGPRTTRHRRGGRHPARTATRRGEHASDQLTLELLDFVGLRKDANLIASALSYGGRRRLEIARASPPIRRHLVGRTGGRHEPVEKLELAALIRRVRNERNVSVLLMNTT